MNKSFKEKLKNIPKSPGVYRFLDKEGTILYVGKAIDLRNRIRSYFQKNAKLSPRIKVLVSKIEDIQYTVVSSELEAIVLETNLIKELRPKYNVVMKDDKNFLYIKITKEEDFPRVLLVRKIDKDKSLYFGPKTSGPKLRGILKVLKKIFPFCSCNLRIKYITPLSEGDHKVKVINKNTSFPCLDYHIKRCLGPCIGKCSKDEYQKMINKVISFLKGNPNEVIQELNKEMEQYAKQRKFEQAANIRDKIQSIDDILEKQLVSAPKGLFIDVINYLNLRNNSYFTLFQVRDGKLINQENFILETKSSSDITTKKDSLNEDKEEILESFIVQYYEKAQDLPKDVLVPHEISNMKSIEKWLTDQKGHKVTISLPVKGEKKQLIDLSFKNAKYFAQQNDIKWLDSESKKDVLKNLQSILQLDSKPNRIEGYDISHLSGNYTVGSMVVFENGKANKKEYKRFKIKTLPKMTIDDYCSLKEVLDRRFKYLIKNKTNIKLKKITKSLKSNAINKLPKYLLKDISNTYVFLGKKEQLLGIINYEKAEKYELFENLRFIDDLNEDEIQECVNSIISKSKKSRLYFIFKKSKNLNLEQFGFRYLKQIPEELEVKKGYDCYLLDKNKYTQDRGFEKTPDLILIDGGKGQLNSVLEVAKKHKITIPIISLAKKEELIFVQNKKQPIGLDKDSKPLNLLQNIRNEAHRFAINYNKKLRIKSISD